MQDVFEEFKIIFRRPNNAYAQLIAINVIVFLFMAFILVFSRIMNVEWIAQFVVKQFTIPPDFYSFLLRPWTLITYSFAHSLSDIFHILFNMLVLYWFGKLFVAHLGSDKLVALYLLGAIGGGIAYLLIFNTVPYFIDRNDFIGMVGASASVYAIVAATATLLPNYKFYLLFLGSVKIKHIAVFYIVLSFIGTVGSNAGGNIAHLGGALIGFLYIKQLQAGVDWGSWIIYTIDWLFRSKPPIKVTYRKTKTPREKKTVPAGNVSQEEIDTILDKISEKGYESLTSGEKEKLFNASKK